MQETGAGLREVDDAATADGSNPADVMRASEFEEMVELVKCWLGPAVTMGHKVKAVRLCIKNFMKRSIFLEGAAVDEKSAVAEGGSMGEELRSGVFSGERR